MDGTPLQWRIYYRDGHTVTSRDSTWEQAPNRHIVAIAWRHGDGPVKVELGTPYYMNLGDWIARIWDPSLYLRKLGVKFGRWTTNEQFSAAWAECVSRAIAQPCPVDHPELPGGLVCATREASAGTATFQWAIYYDDHRMAEGDTMEAWNATPPDGVLAVYYHRVISGIQIAFACRRLTHYYWKKNGELENLDFLEEVLPDFPQFKYGEPSFTGRSYLEQGKAIAAALSDTLGDL